MKQSIFYVHIFDISHSHAVSKHNHKKPKDLCVSYDYDLSSFSVNYFRKTHYLRSLISSSYASGSQLDIILP